VLAARRRGAVQCTGPGSRDLGPGFRSPEPSAHEVEREEAQQHDDDGGADERRTPLQLALLAVYSHRLVDGSLSLRIDLRRSGAFKGRKFEMALQQVSDLGEQLRRRPCDRSVASRSRPSYFAGPRRSTAGGG
jgi:hypothetical protein